MLSRRRSILDVILVPRSAYAVLAWVPFLLLVAGCSDPSPLSDSDVGVLDTVSTSLGLSIERGNLDMPMQIRQYASDITVEWHLRFPDVTVRGQGWVARVQDADVSLKAGETVLATATYPVGVTHGSPALKFHEVQLVVSREN